MVMKQIQAPRGTKDIIKENQRHLKYIISNVSDLAEKFTFSKIDTPVFEFSEIYTKGIGTNTDIIDKELFAVSRQNGSFEKEEGKSSFCLRPEGTAGVVRAYIENGMQSWTQPVKLWYEGPMFRYDKPQKGRFREFRQAGFEIIGDSSEAIDALTILVAWEIFNKLDLKNEIVIEVNSVGCQSCRVKIKKILGQYFNQNKFKLCQDCNNRIKNNPLRVLDCKNTDCRAIIQKAPQILDLLDNECKKHFQGVLEYLDEMEIPYDINPYLVRGLDYYTKTTFEILLKGDDKRQNSLGGGGRYDNLIELFGGQKTPAVGFALGLDRIIELLQERKIKIPEAETPNTALIQVGEKARKKSLAILKNLIENDVSCIIAPGKDSLKSQIRLADRAKAMFALIVGQKEALDNTIIIKNLDDGSQETVMGSRLVEVIKKKLS